ncbi:MAG: DNA mismatch repair endonuclease MutL [Desulfobacterales bacterium]|nr:MAG: DNA mismatch repair endonuclease MutL [Desulfobacterales bacterium]
MSKIKILPEILSNKIAAGEVVERPASVVKELVENALDANSTRIIIDLEKGGRSLIRVADNGSGMGRDDALLSIERYATSKIYQDQDLLAIKTLGFRGEALPSIAAVSRFSLVTRDVTSGSGTEIVLEGGKIKKVSEVGAPTGTMVTVKQLFFNTPARRKFMKTVNTEMSHVADTVASIALGQPDVQFRLAHNAKTVKSWSATVDPLERVTDVLGRELKKDLHPIEFNRNALSISGWIASPRVTRSTSRGIYFYVNGRIVRDRIIQHALFEGYTQRLVKGQFPLAVVRIEVPFDQVDVNVHPTKNEVRFVQQSKIHAAVKRAVAEALDRVDRPNWAPTQFSASRSAPEEFRIAEEVKSEFRRRKGEGEGEKPEFGLQSNGPGTRRKIAVREDNWNQWATESLPEPATRNLQSATLPRQSPIWEKKKFGDLRVIGQLHHTYIVCEADEDLVLIDQHAAHERILFEQISRRSGSAPPAVQQLLIPETLDLGYREADLLHQMIPDLKTLGLEIEPFGGNTFVIKSVPSLLVGRELKALVREMVEQMAAVGWAPGLEKALEHCRKIMACHGAIRANQPLAVDQLKGLLQQLDECSNPVHCPHGRPTWIRWDLNTIEKLFNRIV